MPPQIDRIAATTVGTRFIDRYLANAHWLVGVGTVPPLEFPLSHRNISCP
jgi:hypothetical protein